MSYRSNIWKVYVYHFFANTFFFTPVIVPFFTVFGGIHFFEIMILQSIYVVFSFVFEIPTGVIADRYGRRTSLTLGSVSFTAGVLLYGINPSFPQFIAAEIVWALAHALMSGAEEALLYDSLKEMGAEDESRRVLVRYNSASVIAAIISAPVGSMIAARFGLQYAMLLVVIPGVLTFALAMTFREPKHIMDRHTHYLEDLRGAINFFAQHKELKILVFDAVSFASLLSFIQWLYQPLLIQLGIPLKLFGLVTAGTSLIQVPVMNSIHFFEKSLGSKSQYIFLAALISGISCVFLWYFQSVFVVFPCILLIYAFGFTRFVSFQNYMNKYIESKFRATVISMISMMFNLARTVLAPLVGLLVEWNLRYAFLAIGALIITFAVISEVEEHHLLE